MLRATYSLYSSVCLSSVFLLMTLQPGLADSATYGKLAAAISADELAHVKALRATLGFAAAQSPALNISAATFNTLFQTAMYANGVPDGAETFDPYANELNWALGAFIFEDVGVTGACC
jgi:Ferritin-like domain